MPLEENRRFVWQVVIAVSDATALPGR